MAAPLITILTVNDPQVMRIHAPLAEEIGLDESIALLQLEWLVRHHNRQGQHEHDGRLWYYSTLADLRTNHFKWWSASTISRILKRLEEKGLIFIGNYNATSYDRTQWFAMNPDGLRRLTSIKIDETILQNAKSISSECKIDFVKMQNRFRQNDATIPEINPETNTETTTHPDAAVMAGAAAPAAGGVAGGQKEKTGKRPAAEGPNDAELLLKRLGVKSKTKRAALREVPVAVIERFWAAIEARSGQLDDPGAVLAAQLADWAPQDEAPPPTRKDPRAEDARLVAQIEALAAQLPGAPDRTWRSELEGQINDLQRKRETLLAVSGGAR